MATVLLLCRVPVALGIRDVDADFGFCG